MLAFGFLALIGSMTIYATASNIFVFYIGGTLLGVGLTFTTTTMASTLVRRWFKKDIGKYTGNFEYITIGEGMCYVAFPEDAHMPGSHLDTPAEYVKLVVKLEV